jgi:hypothetical protein
VWDYHTVWVFGALFLYEIVLVGALQLASPRFESAWIPWF